MISIILGTRPEIVKFSPLIRQCQQQGTDYFVLHTGQHYSYNMDQVFFDQLNLSKAKYNLDVGSGTHGHQTGKMLMEIEDVLLKEKPHVVLVEGDTTTALAGALAAAKLGIKVAHVEAGLRSYDREMPEEINRVLVDHCSDYLFAPTAKSAQTLLNEGVEEGKVFTVGNTVVDALYENLQIANAKDKVLPELGLEAGKYVLATAHRQENVDKKEKFAGLIKGLQLVQQEFAAPLVYPIHPRARKQLELFEIDTSGLTLVEPSDYLAFLQLESKAKLVLSDSGGVQEETCVLGVPCVTLRENTERPETLDVGSNMLAGTSPSKILEAAKFMCQAKRSWVNPFGDGTTSKKILSILPKN